MQPRAAEVAFKRAPTIASRAAMQEPLALALLVEYRASVLSSIEIHHWLCCRILLVFYNWARIVFLLLRGLLECRATSIARATYLQACGGSCRPALVGHVPRRS